MGDLVIIFYFVLYKRGESFFKMSFLFCEIYVRFLFREIIRDESFVL